MAVAGRGPAPKDPSTRRRRNADPVPTTVVVADGQLRGPDLPDGYDWPAQTRRWWETWRSSPQSQALTETDWDFLLDTALLHAELWAGNGSVAAELRLRVAKFGATPEDRARLRMQVTEPTAPEKPKTSRYGHLRAVKPA
jgi:hypothetical protein